MVSFQHHWDSEVCILQGDSRQDLIRQGEQLRGKLSDTPEVKLKDLAYTLNVPLRELSYCLAIVATSLEDLKQKLAHALERLADPQVVRIKDISGIYFFEEPLARQGTLAFLFPGEGSQYINMLSDLCLHFPEVRAWFDLIDRAFIHHKRNYLPSQVIFPPPTGRTKTDRELDEKRLWQMDCGPEAIFTANQALFTLLSQLHIRPQAVLGHSTGEYSALFASGAIQIDDEEHLIRHILELNELYEHLLSQGQIPEGRLVAVGAADRDFVLSLIENSNGLLYMAMDNCPHQMVLCGAESAVGKAIEQLRCAGAICNLLPFSRAYHTPLFKPFADQLRKFFRRLKIAPPAIEMYSCAIARPYPQDPAEIRRLAVDQWAQPVRFQETIEAMYEAGVRIFAEVGPRGNLVAFVNDILRGRPYLAVAANVSRMSGISQINHLVGLLAAHGVSMRLDNLYARRAPQRLTFAKQGAAKPGELSGSIRLEMGLQPLQIRQDHLNSKPDGSVNSSRPPQLPTSVIPDHATVGQDTSPKRVSSFPDSVGRLNNESSTPAPKSSRLPMERLSSSVQPTLGSNLHHQNQARSEIMQEYLGAMEKYLDVQKKVMQGYLGNIGAVTPPVPVFKYTNVDQPPQIDEQQASQSTVREGSRPQSLDLSSGQMPVFPFISTVTSFVPGEELVALRRLDLDEDIFLRHHTLGGQVSVTDPALTGLPVVPLTISMEMLVEAAVTVLPDKLVIGMKDIRAYRWIALDENPITLQLIAKRVASTSEQAIKVQIQEVGGPSTSETRHVVPIIEGTVIFGDSYPASPPTEEFSLQSERPSKWAPEQLYTEGMFHGPSFQGVVAIDRWGEDGIEATLKVLSTEHLFRSISDPHFLIDPVLLDAAGQLVGYWTAEHLETGFNVFPFRVEALHIYRPSLQPGETVKCRARIALIDQLQVHSNIDVIAPDGHLLARLAGWEDKRFDLPDRFYRLRISPRKTLLSKPWPLPVAQCPDPAAYHCCRLDEMAHDFLTAHGEIWQRVLAHLVLSRREREMWQRLKGTQKRKTEWLLGRAVAKDAVRLFLKNYYGMELCPADIEITQDMYGRPLARGQWTQRLERMPVLSLAHANGIAVAVAGNDDGGYGIGIDIECIGRARDDFGRVAFTPDEQDLLSLSVNVSLREEWSLRFWCAKEAIAKALGRGMIGGPRSLIVQAFDAQSGIVKVAISGVLAQEFPELASTVLTAYTAQEDDLIVAASFLS